jgi:signal peptidase I
MSRIKLNIKSVLISVVQSILVVLLLVVAIMSFGTRVPFLSRLGFNFFAVTSGSMEPTIPTGALVYTSKYSLDELKEGDVVTYRKTNPETKESALVTHRIKSVNKAEETQQVEVDGKKTERKTTTYTFKTKGDANGSEDQYEVLSSEIVGLYKWHVPTIGYISIFAQQPLGFLLLVILPATVIIVWESVSIFLHFSKGSRLKSEQEIAKLKAELEHHRTQNAQN